MAASANDAGADKYLAESMRRFCRSIELCDDYLRGYYGLSLVRINRSGGLRQFLANSSQTTGRLLTTIPQSRQSKSDSGLPLPDIKTVEKLKEIATAKLSEIVRRSVAGEAGWEGYDDAELIAARERMYIFELLPSSSRGNPEVLLLYQCLGSSQRFWSRDTSLPLRFRHSRSLLTEYC